MPFEIIFFGLVLIYNLFYGNKLNKCFFLICFILSLLLKTSLLCLEFDGVYINLISFLIFVCLVCYKGSSIKFFEFVVICYLLLMYFLMLKHNIFNAIQFNGVSFIVIMFFLLKVIIFKSFLNIVFLFLLISEILGLLLIKPYVGCVSLFSIEFIELIIFALVVDYVIDLLRKYTIKKGKVSYV